MRGLALAAAALAFVVVVVGAYVRLSDAGLGCPDWPLCYGKPMPAEIADADALAKAWKEMGHRYLAGTLGALILVLTSCVVRKQRRSRWLVSSIARAGAVPGHARHVDRDDAAQAGDRHRAPARRHDDPRAADLARPVAARLRSPCRRRTGLRFPAAFALAVLAVQIALGGWVSANYAALACPDLPLCLGRRCRRWTSPTPSTWCASSGRHRRASCCRSEALTAIHWTPSHVRAGRGCGHRLGRASARPGSARILACAASALLVAAVLARRRQRAFSLPLAARRRAQRRRRALLVALVVLNFFAFRGLTSAPR